MTMRTLLVSCLVVWCAAVGGWASLASAETAYMVDASNTLYRFDTGDPTNPIAPTLIGPITGFAGVGEGLSGMDFRPATGQLYALGTQGHLYLLDPVTAELQILATLNAPGLAGSRAMDVDPRADKLRIISYTGANFLVDLSTFTVTTQTAVPGMNGGGLADLAFGPNVRGATGSTIVAIDAVADVLYQIGNISDSNGSSQASGTKTTIGSLGINVGANVGFDMVANSNLAYLLAMVNGTAGLYRVSLTTGAATLVSTFPGMVGVRALAVYSQRQRIYAVTANNKLVTVDSHNASHAAANTPSVPVSFSGLQPNEQIIAIDVRPSTGVLYGFTDTSRLYTIAEPQGPQQSTVQATFVAAVAAPNDGFVGMDFSPTTDRLWITNNASQTFVVNPTTGAVVTSSTAQNRRFVGLASTESVPGAAISRLLAIDATTHELVTMTPNLIQAVTTVNLPITAIYPQGFDISPLDNAAFFSYSIQGQPESVLYALDTRAGGLLILGKIYSSETATKYWIRDIAVASPGIIQVGVPTSSVGESSPTAPVSVQRKNGKNGPVSVLCSTTDGTATATADYTATRERIVFGDADVATKFCDVPITNDTDVEPGEVFSATLRHPFGGTGFDTFNPTMFVTILDNDGNGPGPSSPSIAITTPTTASSWVATAASMTLAGTAQDLDGTVAKVEWSTSRGYSGLAAGTASWTATGIPLLDGLNVVTAIATDNDGNVSSDVLTVSLNAKSYYLTEGATGAFFDLDIAIANPNSSPAPVRLTFLREGATPILVDETLEPTSRQTIRVDAIPGLESTSVSTIVTSVTGLPLLVERTMAWGEGGYGAHMERATDGPAMTWYFAEGSQGFFSTYLLLANPNAFDITADVEYLIEGVGAVTRHYTMPAQRRLTVDAGTDGALVGRSFGMVVRFSDPAVAERAMYFGTDPLWKGGHGSAGVTSPSTQWFLAEGATGSFFETFLLVANPNDQPATVVMTYLPENGTPVIKPAFTLGAKQRMTFNIEHEDPTLTSVAVATQITADQPILVERAQYWPDPAPNWYEAHNSFGADIKATRWGLAEGRVGGASGYQTFILLANTNDTPAEVSITFLRENGTTLTKGLTVPATSRLTVPVGPGTLVPELRDESFGALIASDQSIVVEHALYWNVNGQIWAAGTDALGAVLYLETAPAPNSPGGNQQ
jgi:hypothetical protein